MGFKAWVVIVLAVPAAIKSLWELAPMILGAAGGVGMQPDYSRMLDIIFNIMALIGIGGLVRYWALEAVRKAVVTVPEANEKLKQAHDLMLAAARENRENCNRLEDLIGEVRAEVQVLRSRLDESEATSVAKLREG